MALNPRFDLGPAECASGCSRLLALEAGRRLAPDKGKIKREWKDKHEKVCLQSTSLTSIFSPQDYRYNHDDHDVGLHHRLLLYVCLDPSPVLLQFSLTCDTKLLFSRSCHYHQNTSGLHGCSYLLVNPFRLLHNDIITSYLQLAKADHHPVRNQDSSHNVPDHHRAHQSRTYDSAYHKIRFYHKNSVNDIV